MSLLKKKLMFLMFLIIFTLPSFAEWEDQIICQVGGSCDFLVETVNESGPINQEICNLTVWNTTDSENPVFSLFMNNHTNGFHNYSWYANESGEYRYTISCLIDGIFRGKAGKIVVGVAFLAFDSNVLLPVVLIGFAFLAIAFFIISRERQNKEDPYFIPASFFGIVDFTLDNGIALLFLNLALTMFTFAGTIMVHLANLDSDITFLGVDSIIFLINVPATFFWVFFGVFVIMWGIDKYVYRFNPVINGELNNKMGVTQDPKYSKWRK